MHFNAVYMYICRYFCLEVFPMVYPTLQLSDSCIHIYIYIYIYIYVFIYIYIYSRLCLKWTLS